MGWSAQKGQVVGVDVLGSPGFRLLEAAQVTENLELLTATTI